MSREKYLGASRSKRKARRGPGLLGERRTFLPVILNDQVIDDAVGFVDMVDGAIAQPADGWIIFFAGNIVMRFVEQLLCPVKAASAVHVRVDRRMVFQVLAVINRGVLDFPNGLIDLVDGVLFFAVHMAGVSRVSQVGARVPQVGERMQVGRMPSRFVSKSQAVQMATKNTSTAQYRTVFIVSSLWFLVVPFGG